MDPILAVIDEALLRTGLTDAAASKLAVGNYSLLKNMRSARSDDKRYSYQALEQLARVLSLECYFGPKRQFGGFSEGESTHEFVRKDAIAAGFLPIPWHPAAKRKGSAPVALSQLWLEAEGIIPDFLQAVVPDLMNLSFALAKNTVAVLNTAAARKGSGGYWCFKDGTQIGIARVAFSEGLTVLLPSDDAGEVRIIHRDNPGNFSFLGRVVWMGILTT